jgi:L-gulono-1,4-lactone dehydrogenase
MLLPVTWINWAGDERCSPAAVVRPRSVEELAAAVRDAGAAGRTVRVAGAGHSFGDLVTTDGVLLQLDGLAGVLAVDRDAGLVRVGAGTRLHALNAALDMLGLALPNLGDIDRQSVAGAISTATHGTGARLGNLATQVEELDLVLADGSVLRCAPGSDELRAARVSLGALGVLATVTLRVVPAFRLRAEDRAHPLADTLAALDERVAGADHFEFYVFPHSDRSLTRTNTRTDAPAAPRGRLRRFVDEELVPNDLLGAVCRLGRRFPGAVPRLNRQVAAAFSANVRTDVSHRVFTSPRRVRFTEMEWALPRAACVPVLRAALRAAERHVVNFPIEVRFTAADEESFLSPSWCRDTAYVAVHAFAGMPWEPYFRDVQDVALAHDGRPHWGKRHFLDAAALAPRYPAWDQFQAVRDRLDPERRFTNAHVARVLGG